MRFAAGLLAAGAALYGLWVLLLWATQARMAYPIAGVPVPSAAPPSGATRAWVEGGGARVETWFLPPRGAASARAPAVLFGHGNGETIDALPEALAPLSEMGLGVLLVEYPGYGRSTGKPSETSIRETFLAAFDLLAARPDVDPAGIAAFGQSLGGGAICTLLGRRPVRAAILLSTFTSARIFAARYLAPAFLVRDVFDNVQALARYDGPVLVLHGRADRLVPPANAEALRKAARRAQLRTYPCEHGCLDAALTPLWADVAAFLRGAGLLPAEPLP